MSNRSEIVAYPLTWPIDRPRCKSPESSVFKTAADKAHANLLRQIGQLGGTSVIVSSNCPIGTMGRMRFDREPVDGGVAVYFSLSGKSMVFACDRYDMVRDNVHAIALTIEALRGIKRWGASDMMERAFSGFKRLEAQTSGMSWWEMLQVKESASAAEINEAYRRLAKLAHPDLPGGNADNFNALSRAREQGLNARKG